MRPTRSSRHSIDQYVHTYGDLIYDLCESILQNPDYSQIAFRSILRRIRWSSRFYLFQKYERAWVLKITCDRLFKLCHQKDYSISTLVYKESHEESHEFKASETLPLKMEHFNTYFRRLIPEDQILLLLKDKHQIPFAEIAMVMEMPIGSVKIKRQQALRALEEWIWTHR